MKKSRVVISILLVLTGIIMLALLLSQDNEVLPNPSSDVASTPSAEDNTIPDIATAPYAEENSTPDIASETPPVDENSSEPIIEETPQPHVPVNQLEPISAKIAGENVSLRAQPNTNAERITSLQKGQEITIHSFDNLWGYVDVDETYGYVYMEYIATGDMLESSLFIEKRTIYTVGTDIPAGTYTIYNDGSKASKVTIGTGLTAEVIKPEILITSRYLDDRERFNERVEYVEAVLQSGAEPVRPYDDEHFSDILRGIGNIDTLAAQLAEKYDGLLLTGGGDIAGHFFGQTHHPKANEPDEALDAGEIALCKAFIEANKPVLGICRGMQIINVAMGGDIIQDIPSILGIAESVHQGARHNIDIEEGSWLYEIIGAEKQVISRHHQSVGKVAEGFTVAAKAGDVIEAFENGDTLGVQFHPESMLSDGMIVVFLDFAERCGVSSDVLLTRVFTGSAIIEVTDGQQILLVNADIVYD